MEICTHILKNPWGLFAGEILWICCGLVHGHLHGGNILVENEMGSVGAKITDTILDFKSVSSQQTYGVIPFVGRE
ncbi:hypothetical protein RhiirC2_843873 [Rhizophagus irregularis]|uniref:Protein kinase domain-containing protein n=1 Tax=Rhizophagus irregularis TaxID=588596 RepID=A0A2N1NVR3_9GLOM|nr:hypothetical protein RhiirC2_843873 [Rhizophagus irregularis]